MDFWRDDSPISYRRLGVLIEHLAASPTSALWGAMHEARDWSPTDYILANVYDALASANWQRAGDQHAERPRPLPRPGDEDRKRDQITAIREAHRARQAARERGEM